MLRLRIKEDGTVYLSVPLFMSQATVEQFLQDKYDWMQGVLNKIAQRPTPTIHYTAGDTLMFLGEPYTLQVKPIARGNAVEVNNQTILLYCPADASMAFRKKIIDNFLRKQLHLILQPMVQQWLMQLGESPVTWTIRDMRTEWGSCTPKRRTLRFNLKLIGKPLSCIEYVVVHELTHLKVPNHGPAFKQRMTQYLPDWKERKATLNKY